MLARVQRARALSTSISPDYSFVQKRLEYRREVKEIRKAYIAEQQDKRERQKRHLELERQRIEQEKAVRQAMKQEQRASRAKEIELENKMREDAYR